jgi:hypothetical protein
MAQTKQGQYNRQVFERFLTGNASARYLCQHIGMADLASELAPVLGNLQEAHERLVSREANRVIIQIVKSLRAKVVSVKQAQEVLQLDGAALNALSKHLYAQSKQNLASPSKPQAVGPSKKAKYDQTQRRSTRLGKAGI